MSEPLGKHQQYWSGKPFLSPEGLQDRDQCVSCIGKTLFLVSHKESPSIYTLWKNWTSELFCIFLTFNPEIILMQSQIGGEIILVNHYGETTYVISRNFFDCFIRDGVVLRISQCYLWSPHLTVSQQFPFSRWALKLRILTFPRQVVDYGADWKFISDPNWHWSWYSTDSKKSLSSLINCSTTINFSTNDLYLYSFFLDVSLWSVLLRHLGSLQQPWDA